MIYLSGCTNNKIEPAMIANGVGLMVQPGTGYVNRIGRYAYWAGDNGAFNPKTYVGDDAFLDWCDKLPRKGCLFIVIPDVSRRPDGSLGGDPVATWAKFQELAPIVRAMGFPVALAAQDGIENMPNLAEQIDACDCLFIAGSTEWKVSLAAERVAKLARNAGKWVHMGRVNSWGRIERAAQAMGCNSADGTYLRFPDTNLPKLVGWLDRLDANPTIPGLHQWESPSHPNHRGVERVKVTA